MAGFIWTAILYFSTLSIVFITYRTFVTDRKADNERRAQDMVHRTQARIREVAAAPTPALAPAPVPAPVEKRAAKGAWQRPVVANQQSKFPVAR